jgi:hypothetical protein
VAKTSRKMMIKKVLKIKNKIRDKGSRIRGKDKVIILIINLIMKEKSQKNLKIRYSIK